MSKRAILAALLGLTVSQAPAQTAAVTWTYGPHPLWGLSAHVMTGKESLGLRCLAPADDGPVVAVALTPGLTRVQPNGSVFSYKFMGGEKGQGSFPVDQKAGYFEGAGSACGVSFEDYRAARVLTIDDGAERSKALARIPLTGSKKAIDQLVAACPSIREDLDNCGL